MNKKEQSGKAENWRNITVWLSLPLSMFPLHFAGITLLTSLLYEKR